MEGERFDAFTRRWVTAPSRRAILRGATAALAGLLFPGGAGAACTPEQVERRGVGCICKTTGRPPDPATGLCPCPTGQYRCPDGACAACCADVDCPDPGPCRTTTCQDGRCRALAVTCPPPESPCLASVCDQSLNACVTVPANDGGPCEDDGNACTAHTCQAGECVASNVADGTACEDGICCSGACLATDCCEPCLTGSSTSPQAICCPSGQTCQGITTEDGIFGGCCAADETGCFTNLAGYATGGDPGFVCCSSSEPCQGATFLGGTIGGCCANEGCFEMIDPGAAFDLSNLAFVCCGAEETCQGADLGGANVGACCAPELGCFIVDDSDLPLTSRFDCCAPNETCQPLEGFPFEGFNLCCPPDQPPCFTFDPSASSPSFSAVCCSAGETCVSAPLLELDPDFQPPDFPGLPVFGINTCCPATHTGCPSLAGGLPNVVCCPPEMTCSSALQGAVSFPSSCCCPAGEGCTLSYSDPLNVVECCPNERICPITCPHEEHCPDQDADIPLAVKVCCSEDQTCSENGCVANP